MIERVGRSVSWCAMAAMASVFLVTLAVQPVVAQDRGTFSNRLDRLERDIRTLHRMVAGKEAPDAGKLEIDSGGAGTSTDSDATRQSLARLDVRLTGLESDLRAATGRVEEVSHQLTVIQRRLDKLVADVDFRLTSLERNRAPAPAEAGAEVPARQPMEAAEAPPSPGMGTLGTISEEDLAKVGEPMMPPPGAAGQAAPVMPGPLPPSTPAPAPRAAPNPPAVTAGAPTTSGTTADPAALPAGTPKEQYTYAFGFLQRNKFDEAEAALRAFIDANPEHELAGNARYWLGETYYVRRQYVKSAEVFLEGYQKSPTGNKAPDTLLKLGMSLVALNKQREACATFGKLTKDFPDAPTSILTLAGREREKNGCK